MSLDPIRSALDAIRDEPPNRRAMSGGLLALDTTDWRPLVTSRLVALYKTPEVIEGINKHAKRSVNLAQRAADRLGAAYRRQPRRELGSRRGDRRLRDLLKAADIERVTGLAGRYSWLLGRVGVHVVRGDDGAPLLRVLYPDRTVVADLDDRDVPRVVAYRVADASEERWCVVFEGGWAVVDTMGRVHDGAESHGLSIAWSVTGLVPPGDWWRAERQSVLYDATIEVARLAAVMSWVRSQQNRKLLEAVAESIGDLPRGQATMPESGIELPARPEDVRLAVHDYDLAPTNFVAEMRFHIDAVADAYGVPSQVFDHGDGSGAGVMPTTSTNTLLAELRGDQIPHHERFERDLLREIVRVAPMGSGITADKIDDEYQVSWPPSIYAESPLGRADIYERQISLGIISPVDAVHAEYPNLTRDEAADLLQRNTEERAEHIDFLTKRNLTADAGEDGATLPQAQGTDGARKRWGDDDRDDDRDDERNGERSPDRAEPAGE